MGLLCTALGCLPAQADSILWPDAMDLLDYWAEHPPVHVLVAAKMGLKPKKKTKPKAATGNDMQALANMFNGM